MFEEKVFENLYLLKFIILCSYSHNHHYMLLIASKCSSHGKQIKSEGSMNAEVLVNEEKHLVIVGAKRSTD